MPNDPQNSISLPRETRVRIGTRGSPLARWQADWITAQLKARGVQVELVLITTGGDVTSVPIRATGSQGLFTKEIQRALLDDRIDLAVHSLKDLPTDAVAGLVLAAVPARGSVYDVLVSNQNGGLDQLPTAARIGTGSRRRQAQLLHARADLRVSDIRGNVDTRLKKLDEGQYDAIVLAEAGLQRLGLDGRITQRLPPHLMLPAIGQGALGLECRMDDSTTLAVLRHLDHTATHSAVRAERAMLAELRGGCLAPIGAWSKIESDRLQLQGVVLSEDGSQRLSAELAGPLEAAASLGRNVARKLLDAGAEELIATLREGGPAS